MKSSMFLNVTLCCAINYEAVIVFKVCVLIFRASLLSLRNLSYKKECISPLGLAMEQEMVKVLHQLLQLSLNLRYSHACSPLKPENKVYFENSNRRETRFIKWNDIGMF